MGRLGLESMLEATGREQALGWHLAANLYPPPGEGAYEFALAAIEAVERGEGDKPLHIPPRLAPSANEVVETWHLEAFLETDE